MQPTMLARPRAGMAPITAYCGPGPERMLSGVVAVANVAAGGRRQHGGEPRGEKSALNLHDLELHDEDLHSRVGYGHFERQANASGARAFRALGQINCGKISPGRREDDASVVFLRPVPFQRVEQGAEPFGQRLRARRGVGRLHFLAEQMPQQAIIGAPFFGPAGGLDRHGHASRSAGATREAGGRSHKAGRSGRGARRDRHVVEAAGATELVVPPFAEIIAGSLVASWRLSASAGWRAARALRRACWYSFSCRGNRSRCPCRARYRARVAPPARCKGRKKPHSPFVPAQAGTLRRLAKSAVAALGSRVRGNERLMDAAPA